MKIEKRVFLTNEMAWKKREGFKYVVTYNNTDIFFRFIDAFFKRKKEAVEFYGNLNLNLKSIHEL